MAMVDEALAYAKRGWAVFPLVERDKIPAVKEGFKAADVDPEWINSIWSQRPNCNIGIATGNSLMVIDLDVDDEQGEDGVATLRAWEREHGELPETCSVVTGRGGLHLYYIVDEPVGCSVNKDAGVDIRGDGGYVVAPPSVHPDTGRTYEWEMPPDEHPPERADDNVMAFVRAYSKRERAGVKFTLPKTIGKGERNNVLFKAASSLWARGEDEEVILSYLESINKIRCNPPMAESEIVGIVKSVTERYEPGVSQAVAIERQSVGLMLSSNGHPMQTIENCTRVLAADTSLAGRFFYDERAYTRMVEGPLPWDSDTRVRPVADADYCGLAAYMERVHGLTSKQKCVDAVMLACHQNRRNLVAEWLDSLEWDGEERIAYLLPMFLGCDPSDYNIAAMRLFMLGAVARAYEPGTKFDYMPVLIGPQGVGKSMFLRRLGHCDEWYCDNMNTVDGDAAAEKLRGMWIVEMAELLAVKKQKDVEAIKAFITSMTDTIRPKYARETEQRPRACVFAGTTNNPQFLTDATGNRRFLPIDCGKHGASMSLFDPNVQEYFDQAWAEAVRIWKNERPSLILDERIQGYAIEKQEQYLEDDPRIGIIQEYLDVKRVNWEHDGRPDSPDYRVCVKEIMDSALGEKNQTRFLINEINQMMSTVIKGWEMYPNNSTGKARTREYGTQKCYVPIVEAQTDV